MTSLNSSSPFLVPGLADFSASVITGTVSSTSLIRTAEAEARGTIINIMEKITSDIMICMAYWMNAISEPTCMSPWSIRILPNHIMPIIVKFITSIMTGIKAAIILLTLMAFSVRSALASSKRAFSFSIRLKARITRIPVKFSLSTRFNLSIFNCINLKRGMALLMVNPITMAMTGMTATMTSDSGRSLDIAMIMPPIHMIGAMIIMRMIIKVTVCSWLISLVVRVISVAVPKWLNSCREKLSTRAKILRRKIVPKPVAVLEDKKLAITEQTVPMPATRSINPPILIM